MKWTKSLLLIAVGMLAFLLAQNVRGAVQLRTLVSFNGTNGYLPRANLTRGKNDIFYGTTTSGMFLTGYPGLIFEFTSDGEYKILSSFNQTNGQAPMAALVMETNGILFGTASQGGAEGFGTVFKKSSSGSLIPLVSFNGTNGSLPLDLFKGHDGNLYGITYSGGDDPYYGGGTVFRISQEGAFTNLAAFAGMNGEWPYSVIQGRDGNLYGTTLGGGNADDPTSGSGNGTVFRLTPDGNLTALHSFTGEDGLMPSTLLQASDGNLYGTTWYGGVYGNGTVFQVTTNGVLTTLHSFSSLASSSYNSDGAFPIGKLVEGSDGRLYGGTLLGGTNVFYNGAYGGVGTLYRITTNGIFTTLCSFGTVSNYFVSNGAYPNGLVEDKHGNFYGTTFKGGVVSTGGGYGTVFKLSFIRPSLVVTTPHQHAKFNNSVVTVAGRAKGKAGVVDVFYQLNDSTWIEANTSNDWTNWTANIGLAHGKNIFRVYAIESDGTTSRTNILKLFDTGTQ